MAQRFVNNYRTTVAAQLSTSGTTLAVADASALGTISSPDFYLLTLIRRSGGVETAWEIVRVIARSGNNLTITRGQEGTTPLQWEIGELVECRLTASALAALTINNFTSLDQSYSNGGIVTVAHGLGAEPRNIAVFLRCLTPQKGWAAGTVILLSSTVVTSASAGGVQVYVDASNINARIGASGIFIMDTSGNTDNTAITPANWRLFFKAMA